MASLRGAARSLSPKCSICRWRSTSVRLLGRWGSAQTAYRLVRRGAFPCPVLRVGGRFRVPTTPLMRTLGIEERPLYAVDLEAGLDAGPNDDA